jgi:hypothetical protein
VSDVTPPPRPPIVPRGPDGPSEALLAASVFAILGAVLAVIGLCSAATTGAPFGALAIPSVLCLLVALFFFVHDLIRGRRSR